MTNKIDLEEILRIIDVFDRLEPSMNYTLRQISCKAKRCASREEEVRTLSALKAVNDELHLLERVGAISAKEDPEEIGAYLYRKRLGSEEAREALIRYNAEHFRTTLLGRRKIVNLPKGYKYKSMDDF